jgi:hypothetical protein
LIVVLLTVLSFLSIGFEGALLRPEASYELGFQDEVPKECRPATPDELNTANMGRQGKTSTFNLRGFYVCESSIYEYGDRNSFYTFVADHASQRALEVALKVAKMTEQPANLDAPAGPLKINIEVLTDALPVSAHLRSVFELALVQHAPQVKVLRLDSSEPHSKMRVVVRRMDDASQFIGVSLSKQNSRGPEWIDL